MERGDGVASSLLWTREEAAELAARVEPGLRRINYVFAVYGSVLFRGEGADLDAVVFQLWADPRYSSLDAERALLAGAGGDIRVVEFKPSNHNRCVWTLPDGRWVDLQVWSFFPPPIREGGE